MISRCDESIGIQKINERLADVNDFDLDALNVNRTGRLTLPQKRMIQRRLDQLRTILIVMVGIGIVSLLWSGLPKLSSGGIFYFLDSTRKCNFDGGKKK